MPAPFHQLTVEQFADLLARYPFQRHIDSVHMHHTWRPRRRDYQGLATIEAMWRYHTQTNGWSDIGQHITIAPDGTIWTGRNWNMPPASAVGYNGNSRSGPFMFEMIGDFDIGQDAFDGPQRQAALEVIARLQHRFNLPVETLRFHNQMSSKTCPGSALRRDQILEEVGHIRKSLEEAAGSRAITTTPSPFSDDDLAVRDVTDRVLQAMQRPFPLSPGELNAETSDDGMDESERRALVGAEAYYERATFASRDAGFELTPEIRQELRPHVINLNQGQFSDDGNYVTTKADVDTIFGEHLEKAFSEPRPPNEKLRITLYAHGGLVSEMSGLGIAHKQIKWWLANHVYPIHFVWETGFLETLKQILTSPAAAVSRDIWDHTIDPVIEAIGHKLGGVKLWSGMKRSAELASAEGGGARYAATKLKEFCDRHPGEVELTAIGHSAGSIFHAHFLPAALKVGVPNFRSLYFMAPAIRVDEFLKRLAPLLGKGVGDLTVFTMLKDREQADNCKNVYHKSLLYLIYHALEPDKKTPILGLEESLRGDDKLVKLFGLNGNPGAGAEVVWSKSNTNTGRSATQAIHHGDFDDDPPTMNSIARRILDFSDTAPLPQDFPKSESRAVRDDREELPEDVELLLRLINSQPSPPSQAQPATTYIPWVSPTSPTAAGATTTAPPSGRRHALCVGIDAYSAAPLSGCVADARRWKSVFEQLGFTTRMLTDQQADYNSILGELDNMIRTSAPGDVIAFQYSGHGTTLDDVNGDETEGGNPGQDEALCPIDYPDGRFIIDDDIAQVFARIPEGMNVTCFMDCCHSGTITRVAIGATSRDGLGINARVRFIPATSQMQESHKRFRAQTGRRRLDSSRGPTSMKDVLFSACLDSEVAWESDGQGEFTRRVSSLLLGDIQSMTNEQFADRMVAAFGATPRQHPELDCAPAMRKRLLLRA
jgi:hypothetical protein